MSGWAKHTLIEALKDCSPGLPFSLLLTDNQNVVHHIIKKSVTSSSPDDFIPFKWQRTITNWQWDMCVSTHMAELEGSTLPITQGEWMLLFCGWICIHHATRDTCVVSPATCAASHTGREWQVSRIIAPATSLLSSFFSTSRPERARSWLQAREFGKADQRILEGNAS